MGFGHRVYKNFDPYPKLLGELPRNCFPRIGRQDPLLDMCPPAGRELCLEG